MGNILTLLGLVCIGAGTVLNIFADNKKPIPLKKEEISIKKEEKIEKDPGEAAAGL